MSEAEGQAQPQNNEQGQPASTGEEPLLVVGVGASAGGFEAMRELLAALPAEPGFALVFVQHLDPDHKSMLAHLLGREAPMRVQEIQDGMPVRVNSLYVAPPNCNVIIRDGVLTLQPTDVSATRHRAIDFFLRALARDQGSRAVGVLLSGTASDGVNGLKAIREAGGITLVQDETTARFTSMPRLAVLAGAADFVLAPAQIARELLRIKEAFPRLQAPVEVPEQTREGEWLKRILNLVGAASGVDFSDYKQTTVRRRVLRRIILAKLDTIESYCRFLEGNPGEVQALYQDMVINVTHFFRDPEVFEAFKAEILPLIMRGRHGDAPLRLWVPGCSTGEEVYSFAMAVLEFLGERGSTTAIQIFGTDISQPAIERARAGIYPEGIEADVSAERLQRFFQKRDGGYQIAKPVRDLCVFARQNLVKDPPFSNMDVISCRNVLIYFNPDLQKRVLPLFHYALTPGGYLVLGNSESIGGYADYFAAVDSKHKIYAKKSISASLLAHFPRGIGDLDRRAGAKPAESPGPTYDPQREADRFLLERFSPPCVLIDDQCRVLHFRGRTGMFLEPAPGTASLNLVRMAREGLTVPLQRAVGEALARLSAVLKRDVRVKTNGDSARVDLHVVPLPRAAGSHEKFLLVLFENLRHEATRNPADTPAEHREEPAVPGSAADEEVDRLGQELAATKEYLQSVIESQEAFNEELRSANEEIMSANEELQSTNEELETAKEELQSANEELITLNEELQTRNQELGRVNDDLNNILSSVNIAVVILDPGLRVRRFTPLAEKLLNLIPGDIGRPFGNINPGIEAEGLLDMLREVVDTLVAREMDVRDSKGRWYNLRVRPYKTQDNRIEGALLVLVDSDALKRSERDG